MVLHIQDTTELGFNGRQTTGLGRLSYDAQRGMCLHPTYRVSPQREPLGMRDIAVFVQGLQFARQVM